MYSVAALLIILGGAIHLLQLSADYLGLYLLLGGHILVAAGILLTMRHRCEAEQHTQHNAFRQLEKK